LQQIIRESLASDETYSNEAFHLFDKCGVAFIKMITREAHKIAEGAGRKQSTVEYFLQALQNCGFAEYLEEVKEFAEGHQAHEKQVSDTIPGNGKAVKEAE
jgi:histone H3/H4